KKNQYVILDLSRVNDMDSSGSESIVDLINRYHGTHLHFFIKGLPKRFETLFELFGGKNFLEPLLLTSESDLKDKIGGTRKLSFRGRLLHGVQQFHTDRQQDDRALFKAIAHAQDPHTLFITCADSRVIPSEMTNTDPGELFSIRNVGNLIPIYSTESVHSEAAAIEFALTELNIHDIVICGHSNCGAIKACCEGLPNDRLKQVELWIEQVKKQIAFNTEHEIDYFSRLNVLQQIENLKTYPLVKKYLAKHKIALHAWYFDMHENIVYEWDEKTNTYTAIGEPSKLFKIEISSI
ncbi:MAG: carbonic anhydrase, partial [Gammaproteobacteria bacterium]